MQHGQLVQFGSVWGLFFTLGFYVIIALVIGLGTGRFMFRNIALNHAATGITTKIACAVCGLGLASGIVWGLYCSSLDGFYGLETNEDSVILHYPMPPRTAVLSRDDIIDVVVDQSHHRAKRLELVLHSGDRFYSALDSNEAVERSRQLLRRETAPATFRKSRPAR
jgi:hypothetical protein